MAQKKKWLTYGIAGAMGLTLVGGAAAATAASMNLQSTDGATVPGGAIVGPGGSVLDRTGVQMSVTDTSATVVSATSPTPSPTSVPSPASPAAPSSTVSVVSAPTPVPPPAPAPAPAAPAPAPAPADSPASAPSAGSVASANS